MWGDALLIALALGTLVCFGTIFCIALAEYRLVDPVDYGTPWRDVIELPESAKAASRKFGRGEVAQGRPAANAQIMSLTHDGSATNP